MDFWKRVFRLEASFEKGSEPAPPSLPPELRGHATALIIDYQGDLNRDLEERVVELLAPAVSPNGCRVISYCNANTPSLRSGEPAASLLLFDVDSGSLAGVSLDALVSYSHSKHTKGIKYPLDRLGYWTSLVMGRRVFVVLCLDYTNNRPSFCITSFVDLEQVDIGLTRAKREISEQSALASEGFVITFSRDDNTIALSAANPAKIQALCELVLIQLVRRGVSVKNLNYGPSQPSGEAVQRIIRIQQGLPLQAAEAIVRSLDEKRFKKLNAVVHDDQVRVSSPSRDDLQQAIRVLKEHDFGVDLQFHLSA